MLDELNNDKSALPQMIDSTKTLPESMSTKLPDVV